MLFVQVPYEEAAHTRTFDEPDRHGHVRMYSPEEFCHQLELVGFETERLNFRREFPQLRLDQPDVFVARKAGDAGASRTYDYALLDWAAAHGVQARRRHDYHREPTTT